MEQIESLLKRPALYCNIDGVWELGMGALGMGYFVLIWLQTHSSVNSIWHSMWTLFVYVGILSAGLYFGTKFIKTRITYPRTGFVSYRKSSAVWVFIIAFLVAALVALSAYTFSNRPMGAATPAFLIASLVFVSMYVYRVVLAAHWKWIVAGILTISAVIVAFLPASVLASIAGHSAPPGFAQIGGAFLLLCFAWSTISLISGGISLYIYVRHTPSPGSETD